MKKKKFCNLDHSNLSGLSPKNRLFGFLSMNESKAFYIGEERINKKIQEKKIKVRFFFLKLYKTALTLTSSSITGSLFFMPTGM